MGIDCFRLAGKRLIATAQWTLVENGHIVLLGKRQECGDGEENIPLSSIAGPCVEVWKVEHGLLHVDW